MNEFETEIQNKLDSDTEFQSSLAGITDENEKSSVIESKRKELSETTFKELRDAAAGKTKADQIADDQRRRAEKAEGKLKEIKPDTQNIDGSLSTKDFYALNKANVPEDDIDEVLEFSKFKNVSVSEALKSPILQAVLNQKVEFRRTASAAQTRSTRSQNVDMDGGTIIDNMRNKGEEAIPEGGSKEAEAVFWARRGRKPQ